LGTREGIIATTDQALSIAREGKLGSELTSAVYPIGWTQVSNTPFRYFKRTPMNGGIRVPFIVHAPKHIQDGGAIRKQWIHVTDVLPTLLEILGIAHPEDSNGFAARKPDGKSFAKMLTQTNDSSKRTRQHYELEANCAIIDDGWKLVSLQKIGQPIVENNWMLFNLIDDPCENNDLASKHPDKVQALMKLFDEEARANAVYPLDNRGIPRAMALPPYLSEFINTPRTFYPGMQSISRAVVAPLIADRSFDIQSYFDWQSKQQGVIFAIGDLFVGLAMYVMDEKINVTFHRWMAPIELPSISLKPGLQTIRFEYEALGKRQGRGRLVVNDDASAWQTLSPAIVGLHFEGLDVGLDRRQRTSHRYADRGTFPYSGRIEKVVLTPGLQAEDSVCNKIEAREQEYLRD
jgi:Sulfatase